MLEVEAGTEVKQLLRLCWATEQVSLLVVGEVDVGREIVMATVQMRWFLVSSGRTTWAVVAGGQQRQMMWWWARRSWGYKSRLARREWRKRPEVVEVVEAKKAE